MSQSSRWSACRWCQRRAPGSTIYGQAQDRHCVPGPPCRGLGNGGVNSRGLVMQTSARQTGHARYTHTQTLGQFEEQMANHNTAKRPLLYCAHPRQIGAGEGGQNSRESGENRDVGGQPPNRLTEKNLNAMCFPLFPTTPFPRPHQAKSQTHATLARHARTLSHFPFLPNSAQALIWPGWRRQRPCPSQCSS